MASPIFTENSPFARPVNQTYADNEVMTLDNTMRKSVGMFAMTVALMAVGWLFIPMALAAVASVLAFVLSIVCIFRKEPNPPLYIATTGLYGVAIGAISGYLESKFEGIVVQAVLATVIVIGVTFAAFYSGKFRTTPRLNKIFAIAGIAYLIFSLVNFVLMATGSIDGMFGMRSQEIFGIPIGIIIGIFAVIMGAYSLVIDFEFIENGVANRIPAKYGWTAAYGLVLTIVWIYFEILRVIAIIRN